MKKFSLFTALLSFAVVPICSGQTIWNDGALDGSWNNSGNWSTGTPPNSASIDVEIGTEPSVGGIIVDTGGVTSIKSLTIDNVLTADTVIGSAGVEQLSVSGNITNLSLQAVSLQLDIFVNATATYSGGAGSNSKLTFGNVLIQNNSLSLNGAVEIKTAANFGINSLASYGKIAAGSFTFLPNSKVSVSSNLTFVNGNSFDFNLAGGFSGASLGSLPALTGGLSWDTSNFITSGVLTVIPEPSIGVMLSFGMMVGTGLVARRRRALVAGR